MLRQHSIFSEKNDISPQQKTIQFIREDPCFLNVTKGNFPNEGRMLSQSTEKPSIFYVAKKEPTYISSSVTYISINRTLVVENDGSISIFNGSDKVEENIDDYLYNSAIRELYNTAIKTGFYTSAFVHHDSLRLSHVSDKKINFKYCDTDYKYDNEYFIELFRDTTARYFYVTHGYPMGDRGGLVHVDAIHDQAIIDFHNKHVEPRIAVSSKNHENNYESYFFTLKSLPSLDMDVVEEKISALRF